MRKQVVFSHLSGLAAALCVLCGLVFAAPTASHAECGNIPQLQKKARAGDADAQVDLGMCCLHGRGVVRGLGQATKLFRRAAEQGNADGQFLLGMRYYSKRHNFL